MVRKPKLLSSIRAKLFSAVAMLLVAVIMVVSSTYAWFTLSTAPEVTGMTTAIGANGSLEMALMPADGIMTNIKDGVLGENVSLADRNLYWGNLVDMSDETTYGMDKITLLPSALNIVDGKIQSSMLNVPVYGADGRVEKLDAKGVSGNFVGGQFVPGNELGFRAVGVASGLTDRQLAYRNARSAANTATSQAKNKASTSLNNNGSALANIAITYGMDSTNATYTQEDIAPLSVIIADLNGADGILAKIDYAYMQYMIAYAASAAVNGDNSDAAWSTVEAATKETDATASSVLTALADLGVTAPEGFATAIAKLDETKGNVDTAATKLDALAGESTVTWEQLRPVMTALADPAAMEINGFTASEVKNNLGDLVSSVTTNGGLVVSMASGAGVYADIADHCGDYTASVTIEKVEYNDIVLNNMNAKMVTETEVEPQYLPALGLAVTAAGEPENTGAEVLPMSEFYGYILDLAFRTNATESNLLLQTEATDRIYEGNANENTAGNGSSMTFAATSSNFGNEQVKKLMKNIRIVFFAPDTQNGGGTVLAEARLDTANAVAGADGVTAKMYLYEATKTITNEIDGNKVLGAEDNVLCYVNDGKYYETYVEATTTYAGEITDIFALEGITSSTGEYAKKDDSAIVALNQNTATAISVLVYLDGANLTNADVAFAEDQSVTGSMNLQFSSSATLTPMVSGDLYTPAQGGEEAGN